MTDTVVTSIPGGKAITFQCPNELTRGRAKYLLTKEPGTISWINSFEAGSVFWDVGANIGVYALYAAVARGCQVVAFEPAAANFEGLNANIRANQLDRRIQALCLCLGDTARADFLHMQDVSVGGALHNFGEAIDYKGDRFIPSFLQGSLSVPLDELIERYRLPFPANIKIDVDGAERQVINGGRRTWTDQRLRSVLVEVDLNYEAEVAEISSTLDSAGLRRDDDVPGNKPRPLHTALIYNLIYKR